ncbi:hypothetical protein DM860_004511 [Cuscuta australis]|uniref:Uncharacterized protein n=1 Tax=Cuscuta australis TaxID=267555 RepID=A0A328E8X7_9ASTE|nr:hypothetical protein DM860_004511 [Cuscuta australis]
MDTKQQPPNTSRPLRYEKAQSTFMVIALVCIAVLAVFSGALCILACLFRRLIRRRAGATTPLGGSASVAALPNDERQ